MAFADNGWNFSFERSNSGISKNVNWKALNCENRGEIDQLVITYNWIKSLHEHEDIHNTLWNTYKNISLLCDKSTYCCIVTKTINGQERHFIIVPDVN